jgi:hypothetical protein
MPNKDGTQKLIDMQRWGFWIRTKQTPHRAVRWETQRHEDGRESFRGRNWVEILPHGEDRTPERFFTADVEYAGPYEWLSYYPDINTPLCGWGERREAHGAIQYCPRKRTEGQPFCPKHTLELVGEESHAGTSQPHSE